MPAGSEPDRAESPEPPTGVGRRRFLTLAGGAAGGLVVGAGVWAALVRDQASESAARRTTPTTAPSTTTAPSGPSRPARILVVVQQGGGNDALNTVVPADDGRYRDLRPRIALPEADLVSLTGDPGVALHPSLAPMAPWWDAGHLALVQGVGMDGQSRSHFAAMDAWWSGTPEPSTTGWLGRWLDRTGDGSNPLRGIALGDGSPALVGETLQTTVVRDPAEFRLLAPPGVDADRLTAAFLATAEPLADDPLLAASQRALPATAEAVELLATATGGGGDAAAALGAGRRPTVTELLETAAAIIDLDVGTQVIVVGVSGFDTHQGQAEVQARLLADVGDGIARFLELVEAQGRADDVLVVTTSEFGRRAADNASFGTDHGSGGSLLVAGPGVRGAVVGAADLGDLVDGDVRIGIDTRSVYQAALTWLGGPSDEVLDGRYDDLGVLA